MLLSVARTVGDRVGNAVVRIVDTHTTDAGILHGIAGYLEALPEAEHSSEVVIKLLKRALDGAMGDGSPADDSYLVAGMLRVAVSSARHGDPGRWLQILSAKLARFADPPNAFEFRQLRALDGLGLEAGAPVLQLLVVAIRDVARLTADAGVPTKERVATLERIPVPLAGRLIALHLIETVNLDADAALARLTREVADSVPMPETLSLLRSLTERELPGLEDQMRKALGVPPTLRETTALTDDDDLPASWRRAYGWFDAMPQGTKDAWATANERVEAHGARRSPKVTSFRHPTSNGWRPPAQPRSTNLRRSHHWRPRHTSPRRHPKTTDTEVPHPARAGGCAAEGDQCKP